MFVDFSRSHHTRETDVIEHKLIYSFSKFVPLSDCQSIEDMDYPLSMISSDSSGMFKSNTKHSNANMSREHSSSIDYGSSSKQESSGQEIV